MQSDDVYRPPQAELAPEAQTVDRPADGPVGLGGWLILVALGLLLQPIRIGTELYGVYSGLWAEGVWPQLGAGLQTLIIGELLFNAVVLALGFYLIYAFFTRRRLFPKVYIAMMLISLIGIPVDAFAVKLMLPEQPMWDASTLREFGRTAVASAIWIPYMLVSKRVKATFVH